MPSFAQSFFSRKTALRLVLGLALVVALLFGVRAFENWRGERAWAAYRADAEKRGVHLSLMDFVPPDVPDAENFAAIPIIQEIFAAAKTNAKSPDPWTWPEDLKVGRPRTADPQTGRRLDLAEWRGAFVAAHYLAQPTDNAAQDVLAGFAHYEPVFAQLHTAAQRPHSRFPVQWEKGPLAQTPQYAFVLGAASFRPPRIAAHLALGDSAAAYADWRDGLALYSALEHEPALLSCLIRQTVLMFLENAAWDGLAGRQWAEPELRSLSADFASLNLLANMEFTFASERGMTNATMDYLTTLPLHDRYMYWSSISMQNYQVTTRDYIEGWLYPVGWFRQSQRLLNEIYDHRLARIDLQRGIVSGGPIDGQDLSAIKQKGLFAALPYQWAAIIMPSLDTAETRFLTTHTFTQQARLACALELFRLAHGAYPERLEELVPDLLDALPRDAMDGAPMRYRRDGESFKLWSIALNRKDDSGEAGPSPKSADQLDWVWHY